jgi:hypothetical protein
MADKLSQLWGKSWSSMTLGDYVPIAGLVVLNLLVLFLLLATLFDR